MTAHQQELGHQRRAMRVIRAYAGHVAIGSDFGGMPDGATDGLASVADYPNLWQALEDRGLDHGLIENVAYRNAARFLAESLG